MPKMLMGQINHAKDRVAQLTKLKLEEAPKAKSHKSDDLKADLRNGNYVPTSAQLTKAFQLLNTKATTRIIKGTNRWYNEPATYNIRDEEPEDIYDALYFVIDAKKIAADVAAYQADLDEYNRKKNIIHTEAQRVEDIIVLGDQHAVLQALQDFEAFEVE